MKHTSIIVAIGFALAAALPTASAYAQNLRSFVSGHGSDSNNCTLATPCRTFQAAFNVTNAGGEITVLDSAGYGGLTINKAISIVNPGGVEGGIIVPSGGTGIVINAGVNDAVSLRGLTIDGQGVGTNGIVFNSGKSLTIANCVIRQMTGNGIAFYPNAASDLSVSDSRVADNGVYGIYVAPSGSNTVTAVFNRVEVNNNSTGIYLNSVQLTGAKYLEAALVNSFVVKNASAGIQIGASSQNGVIITIEGSKIMFNNYGIYAGTSADTEAILSRSTIILNTSGDLVGNGYFSMGDNILGNGTAQKNAYQ